MTHLLAQMGYVVHVVRAMSWPTDGIAGALIA